MVARQTIRRTKYKMRVVLQEEIDERRKGEEREGGGDGGRRRSRRRIGSFDAIFLLLGSDGVTGKAIFSIFALVGEQPRWVLPVQIDVAEHRLGAVVRHVV